MAYFPNGTAGMDYDSRYCWNCIHWPQSDDDEGCSVWLLHHLYNYDQCDDDERGKTIKAVLETLIPSTKDDLGAEQCTMFRARVADEAAEAEQRRLAEQPRKYQAAMQHRPKDRS